MKAERLDDLNTPLFVEAEADRVVQKRLGCVKRDFPAFRNEAIAREASGVSAATAGSYEWPPTGGDVSAAEEEMTDRDRATTKKPARAGAIVRGEAGTCMGSFCLGVCRSIGSVEGGERVDRAMM